MPDADQMRLGSLCTGYGGLDLACRDTLGTRTAWVAENDPHAAKVCRARFKAPNLGDIKTIDWTTIQPVDVLTAGYPCQPFSHAGKRRGADDPRHIWPYIAEGVRHLRPRLIVLENVAGHLTKGFGEVVGTLAAMGYDATWGCVRASDAGGCHQRKRVFIVAADADRVARPQGRALAGRPGAVDEPGAVERTQRLRGVADGVRCPECGAGWNSLTHQRHAYGWRTNAEVATDTDGAGRQGHRRPVERPRELAAAQGGVEPLLPTPTAADGERRSLTYCRGNPTLIGALKLLPTPTVQQGRNATSGRTNPDSAHHDGWTLNDVAFAAKWGDYAAAIARWEPIIGRPVPEPVDAKGRLSPVFVEWMMGLPAGWVTSLDMARSHMLARLGNGVVPQQATLALHHLLPRL